MKNLEPYIKSDFSKVLGRGCSFVPNGNYVLCHSTKEQRI